MVIFIIRLVQTYSTKKNNTNMKKNFIYALIIPGNIIVHELEHRGVNEIIYEENGVVIRSWPAIHAGDGPVSFSMEWNGYKVVFGGDTFPNNWFYRLCKRC